MIFGDFENMSPQQEAPASPRVSPQKETPASPRGTSTASGEEEDDGFEFIQITIRTWESIVSRGLFLRRKSRLWGVLGGYLKSIKQRGLQEGLSLADKKRFWGQLGGYLKSKKGTSKIMACPSLSPLAER